MKMTLILIAVASAIFSPVICQVQAPAQTPIPAYLPNPAFTPGEMDSRLTDAVLLAPGFTTKTYRPPASVTNKIKVQAFKLYGIPVTKANMAAYELDHAIPLALSGATTIKNLWPEKWFLKVPINGVDYDLGAHTKDRLEDYLILAFRKGKIDRKTAIAAIYPDWTVGYKKYLGAFPKYTFSASAR